MGIREIVKDRAHLKFDVIISVGPGVKQRTAVQRSLVKVGRTGSRKYREKNIT